MVIRPRPLRVFPSHFVKLLSMSSFERLLAERKFEEVLRMTDSGSLRDANAMFARAQVLMFLRRYQEAMKVLTEGAEIEQSPSQRDRAKRYFQTCNAVLSFAEIFTQRATQVSKIPEDWYKLTMIENIDAQRNAKTRWERQYSDGEVYILSRWPTLKYYGDDERFQLKLRTAARRYLTQVDRNGYLFERDQTFQIPFSTDDTAAKFPLAKWGIVGQVVQPHPECDVFVVHKALDEVTHQLLVHSLDDIAEQTKDYFVPMYQNIIDPDLSVHRSDTSSPFRWKATDFLVQERVAPVASLLGTIQGYVLKKCRRMLPRLAVELIFAHINRWDTQKVRAWGTIRLASPIPGVPLSSRPGLYLAVDRIMTVAAPLMAKLRKPALLLPGRLQAVVKAQRIYLQPGEEYCGVWHTDGKYEAIVAVILYYYRMSEGLEGGSLEFLSRRPRKEPFWLGGDCDYPERLTKENVKKLLKELPGCKVPVQEGTMVVFSNYQLVHRVLRMTTVTGDPGTPDGYCSRDFLAFFIVDQRDPLPSTLHSDLAVTSLDPSTGIGAGSSRKEAQEVAGALVCTRAGTGGVSLKERIAADPEGPEAIRWSLFTEQMKPSGQFGLSNDGYMVYSTDNGSLALLGYFDNDLSKVNLDEWGGVGRRHTGIKWLQKIIESLPRGTSWVIEEAELCCEEDGDSDAWDSEEREDVWALDSD